MFHLLKFKDLSLYLCILFRQHTQQKRRAQTPQNLTFPHQGAAPKAQSMSPPLILRFTWTSMPPKRNRPGTSNQPGNNCSSTLCFHPIPGRYFFGGWTHSGKLLISPHLPDMSKPYDHCLHQRLSLPTRTPAWIARYRKWFCRLTWKRSQRCKPGADKRGRSRLSQLRMPNLYRRFLLLLLDSVEHLP